MELQHFSHNHHLTFGQIVGQEIKDRRCNGCSRKIDGPAYSCEICDFLLHKLCAELPREMLHPLHSHTLTLLAKPPYPAWSYKPPYFVCEECRDVCFGFTFHCSKCQFNLDVKCASLTDHDRCQLPMKGRDRKTSLNSSFHRHILTLTNLNKEFQTSNWSTSGSAGNCRWCHLRVSGLAYCCFDCQFYLHESCSDIPNEVHSPFHPQHSLFSKNTDDIIDVVTCRACKMKFFMSIALHCAKCKVSLHFLCSKPQMPMLRLKMHKHDLLYFTPNTDGVFRCTACGDYCNASFYRCVRCDINFHLECIPIPKIAKCERHFHPLILTESFKEDDSGEEYYCDVCEGKRDPESHFYYCKECSYFAHIECVINESVAERENHEEKQSNIEEESNLDSEKDADDLENEMKIQHFNRQDDLTSLEDSEICEEVCQIKSWAELPREIVHPLHSIHPLALLAQPPYSRGIALCDQCKYLCTGFIYHCDKCLFSLDLKCSTSLPFDQEQRLEDRETINYFLHRHKLTFFHARGLVLCDICGAFVKGLGYGCIPCSLFMHDSCAKFPKTLQHPSHPQHPLSLWSNEFRGAICRACREKINHTGYYLCFFCDFYLHLHCANSIRSTLKLERHEHLLLYFPTDFCNALHCSVCDDLFHDVGFYRCVECDLSFHVKCILPSVVKHECHFHPLTLKDPFVEDDSGEHYCDVCEKKRNPDYHVYSCEECAYFGHIRCVISEAERVTA